jgi:hypothetical protein
MKNLWLSLGVILLAGCSGVHKKGVSHYDDYDGVRIDQMVGNSVSGAVFQKVIVCLNARREAHLVTAMTSVSVTPVTNQVVTPTTNQTISVSTNYLVTTMTNLVPAAPTGSAPAAAAAETNETANVANAALADAATLPPLTNAPTTVATNVTLSVANNKSATSGANQSTANNQLVRTLNNQITTTSNNLTIALMTNLVVTAETNEVINYITNTTISSVTNVTTIPTNYLAYDYYLYTEMTPPPDFILQNGESLVLLVDGVRYGLTLGPPASAFIGRRGFVSGLYRVPPQVLVAIANAREVRIRFKGVNTAIERDMNTASRENFKAFLMRYFTNPPEVSQASARGASSRSAETRHASAASADSPDATR